MSRTSQCASSPFTLSLVSMWPFPFFMCGNMGLCENMLVIRWLFALCLLILAYGHLYCLSIPPRLSLLPLLALQSCRADGRLPWVHRCAKLSGRHSPVPPALVGNHPQHRGSLPGHHHCCRPWWIQGYGERLITHAGPGFRWSTLAVMSRSMVTVIVRVYSSYQD